VRALTSDNTFSAVRGMFLSSQSSTAWPRGISVLGRRLAASEIIMRESGSSRTFRLASVTASLKRA